MAVYRTQSPLALSLLSTASPEQELHAVHLGVGVPILPRPVRILLGIDNFLGGDGECDGLVWLGCDLQACA